MHYILFKAYRVLKLGTGFFKYKLATLSGFGWVGNTNLKWLFCAVLKTQNIVQCILNQNFKRWSWGSLVSITQPYLVYFRVPKGIYEKYVSFNLAFNTKSCAYWSFKLQKCIGCTWVTQNRLTQFNMTTQKCTPIFALKCKNLYRIGPRSDVGGRTVAKSGEVFYGRSVGRYVSLSVGGGSDGRRWTGGSFYFCLEPPREMCFFVREMFVKCFDMWENCNLNQLADAKVESGFDHWQWLSEILKILKIYDAPLNWQIRLFLFKSQKYFSLYKVSNFYIILAYLYLTHT